ncbi:hypothetical protein TNCV_26161 [Trichonephila clavipes]|uniref:Uncharacterized protein n=1 Tax=Trichonephila clavipes TaxID=2585209 RepID=A0A8X7BDA1_TRICX|nr:hypothetical protein TNCV_26161 [Trichonephila clavipes]
MENIRYHYSGLQYLVGLFLQHPLAPEEIEAQGRADKNTDKKAFIGFNKMDYVVHFYVRSLRKFRNTGQDDELVNLPLSSCSGLPV